MHVSVRGVRQRAVTSATVHAQTAAARPTWIEHEPPRQLVPPLQLADRHLHEQQREQDDGGRAEHAGAVAVAHQPAEQEQEA